MRLVAAVLLGAFASCDSAGTDAQTDTSGSDVSVDLAGVATDVVDDTVDAQATDDAVTDASTTMSDAAQTDTAEADDVWQELPDNTSDDAEVTDTDTAPQPDADAATGKDGTDACDGFIIIDFPCKKETWTCTDSQHYSGTMTLTCSDIGYTSGCCSGATCGGKEGTCPSGTICVPPDESLFPCKKVDCTASADCAPDSYCSTDQGVCAVSTTGGLCRTNVCTAAETAVVGPACGCDGNTYPSLCAAVQAGQNFAHPGACCDPANIMFSQDNQQAFTEITFCAMSTKFATVSPTLTDLTCLYNVADSGCYPNGWFCTAHLPTPATGTALSDAVWQDLCLLATEPGVQKVMGHNPATCSTGKPTSPLVCGEPCTDPCGCTTCKPSQNQSCGASNGNDPDGTVQCKDGCLQKAACPAGTTCSQPAGTAGKCVSCPDLSAQWAEVAKQTSCAADSDCAAVPVACSLDFGCTVAVAKGAVGQLAAIDKYWTATGCDTCACATPQAGSAKCISGQCQWVVSGG